MTVARVGLEELNETHKVDSGDANILFRVGGRF